MAPVPKDNQNNKPPNSGDDDGLTNPQLTAIDVMDSSDDSDDDAPVSGYTLLPQDPAENGQTDSEDEPDEDDQEYIDTSLQTIPSGNCVAAASCDQAGLPDVVLQTECEAAAPTVDASLSSLHPDFLAKYPDGKIPAYNQVYYWNVG